MDISSCMKYSHFVKKPLNFVSSSNNHNATHISSFIPLPFMKNDKFPKMVHCNSLSLSNRSEFKMNKISCDKDSEKNEEEMGIVRFLRGKNFLITGATGFLAKVLIEKMLRSNPDVGKIYVIIKAKDDQAAKQRLLNEIVNTELFKILREMHGDNYEDFMLRKIIPVVGDLRETNIGIQPEIIDEILEVVDIIVDSAANIKFDERYDVALDVNTLGPFRLMSFARRMKRLKLFLHFSTAYVNGERQGVVSEKPFCLGDTISNKNSILDVETEIKLAFGSSAKDNHAEMKKLGLERAQLYGWQDAYTFTKAMGEMVINTMREDLQVVMIRPATVESTFNEPFPGWIQGNKVLDPIILHYGKGQLPGFLMDPNAIIDVVPADIVVNATLAAMAKHGTKSCTAMHIYQVGSSKSNPLTYKQLVGSFFDHFSRSPYVDPKGQPVLVQPFKLFTEMKEFFKFISKDAIKKIEGVENERMKVMIMKSMEQAKYMVTLYQPYTLYTGRFDNSNTEKLLDEMSAEEREKFDFDVRTIKWKDYIANVHIPGIRKHVMKGRGFNPN
ncbi:hypothetical protein LUZ60_008654 [Juncus effusus]|nr:hypothetical protein LUZ60_008654 [Juncus effusus]